MTDEYATLRAAFAAGARIQAWHLSPNPVTREVAREMAIAAAKAAQPSYYSEPFEPHEWVVNAIMAAAILAHVESPEGQWDTLSPKDDAEPAFTCPAHLYRVHPEDAHLVQNDGRDTDACKAKYLPKGSLILGDNGDYETLMPCFEVVHRGVRYYLTPSSKRSVARLNEQDAAMESAQ